MGWSSKYEVGLHGMFWWCFWKIRKIKRCMICIYMLAWAFPSCPSSHIPLDIRVNIPFNTDVWLFQTPVLATLLALKLFAPRKFTRLIGVIEQLLRPNLKSFWIDQQFRLLVRTEGRVSAGSGYLWTEWFFQVLSLSTSWVYFQQDGVLPELQPFVNGLNSMSFTGLKKNHHFFTPPFTTRPGSEKSFFPFGTFWSLPRRGGDLRGLIDYVFLLDRHGAKTMCNVYTHITRPASDGKMLGTAGFSKCCVFTPALAIGVDTSEVGVGKSQIFTFSCRGCCQGCRCARFKNNIRFQKIVLDGYIYFRLQFLYSPES